MEEPLKFKVVLIGETGVGKTSILLRYITNKFNPGQFSTIGLSYVDKIIKIDNDKIIKLEIWDTAGQEKFRSLARAFYRNIDVGILVYDVTNKSSFEEIKKFWIKDIKDNNIDNISKKIINIFFSTCSRRK